MTDAAVTQSELARFSGVRQPSVSQFLSGRVEMSDDMLDRLLSCLGSRLEVVRRPVPAELSRSARRSWRLHRQLATHLAPGVVESWRPAAVRNLRLLRRTTQGQPHLRNLDRWQLLLVSGDVAGLRRVMTGVGTDAVEMREVSPLAGLLPQDERALVLAPVRRCTGTSSSTPSGPRVS